MLTPVLNAVSIPSLMTRRSIHRKTCRRRIRSAEICGEAYAVVTSASWNRAVVAQIVDRHCLAALRVDSIPQARNLLVAGKRPLQSPAGDPLRARILDSDRRLETGVPLINVVVYDVAGEAAGVRRGRARLARCGRGSGAVHGFCLVVVGCGRRKPGVSEG